MNSVEPIAIVGIGCRFPGGVKNPDDLWKLLTNGVDAVTEVPKDRWNLAALYHPDPSKRGCMYSRWGGFIDNVDRFDANFFGINRREAAAADPQQRLLLELAYEAVEDAGMTVESLSGRCAAMYVGICGFDYATLQINDRASGAHPVLRRDIVECLKGRSAESVSLPSLRRNEPERAALLASLGRLHCLGAELDWRKLFPPEATPIKLPLYPFRGERYWRESKRLHSERTGQRVHPLLGKRLESASPLWTTELDSPDLSYLADHRIGGSVVFPGAGYVEMALAAARETLGPAHCVLEHIEFQKFLVLEENASAAVQLVLEPNSNEFLIYACEDASGKAWELRARGAARKCDQAPPACIDLDGLRHGCPDAVDPKAYYAFFSDGWTANLHRLRGRLSRTPILRNVR
jgi:acyl transferase domain-containing protein